MMSKQIPLVKAQFNKKVKMTSINFASEGEFVYGTYLEFNVLFMRSNGYINATKLCAQAGKRFDKWLDNITSKRLVETFNGKLSQESASPNSTIFILKEEVSNEVRGTYVHKRLITHIACWCSPEFAWKVSTIVEEFYEREFRSKLMESTELIANKDSLINEKTITINNLHNEISQITVRLEQASIHRVPPALNSQKNEVFVILIDTTYDQESSLYHCIRCQTGNLRRMRARWIRDHPGSEEFIRLDTQPNSVNILIRLKEMYRDREDIQFVGLTDFITSMDEEALEDIILTINNEKLNV